MSRRYDGPSAKMLEAVAEVLNTLRSYDHVDPYTVFDAEVVMIAAAFAGPGIRKLHRTINEGFGAVEFLVIGGKIDRVDASDQEKLDFKQPAG